MTYMTTTDFLPTVDASSADLASPSHALARIAAIAGFVEPADLASAYAAACEQGDHFAELPAASGVFAIDRTLVGVAIGAVTYCAQHDMEDCDWHLV